MAKTKYRYNPETCKYEPQFLSGKLAVKKTVRFLVLALLIAVGGFSWYSKNFEWPDEYLLKQENESLRLAWRSLQKRIGNAHNQLVALIEKDDHNYRIILDSEPLPSSIREAGIGGSEKFEKKEIKNFPVLLDSYAKVEKLKHQLEIELQSLGELSVLYGKRLKMWASRPAIQPISNKNLHHLNTTFGMRLHPILGYWRGHKGLDFMAPKNTPVYATGDGKVDMAYHSETFGLVVYLNHDYGFETRYAHLTKYTVEAGQKVKRGQIIGYVGSTGLSAGSHLHYEVLYNGNQINPINFFQRDLNNTEYEKLIANLDSTESAD